MRRSRKRVPWIRLFLLLSALSVGGIRTLQACECFRVVPACQAAWANGAVVFLGKVVRVSVRVERIERSSIPQKRVTFQVAENFNGRSSRTIEVATGFGGGDCGFPFKEGHEYLVYGSHSPWSSSLQAGICSRTAPGESAAEDLEYLRSLAKGGPQSRDYGFVTGYSPLVGIELRHSEKAPQPIANVPIRLESESTSLRAVTDTEGSYTFDGLPAGSFSLSADMPRNLGGGEIRTVILRDHACSEQNFVAVERGRLTGRLLDDNQRPVSTTLVAMAPAGSSDRADIVSDYTDSQGYFTISRLPPGDFVLGVNISEPPREGKYLSQPFPPTYFPGVPDRADATIIHVQSAQQLGGFELQLPARLRQRTITGRVTWPNGKPAEGAFVELKDSEFTDRNVDLGTAARDGMFIVTGVQGRSYSLSCRSGLRAREPPRHSETVQLKPDDNGPIRLVLSLPGQQ